MESGVNNSSVRLMLGEAYYFLNEFQRAENILQPIVEGNRSSDYPEAHVLLVKVRECIRMDNDIVD